MKKLFSFIILAISGNFVFAQNNVGIGTVTPTDGKLQVENAVTSSTLASFTNGTTTAAMIVENNRPAIGFNMTYNGGGYKFKGAGYGGLLWYTPNDGKMHYYSSSAIGAPGGAVAFSNIFTMQADGNIGIGTTSPSEAKLQIHEPAGNTQFIAAAGSNQPGISAFVASTNASLGFNLRYQSGLKYMGTGYGAYWNYAPATGKLYYYYTSTSGSADASAGQVLALTIDSSGQLGIGTSVPKAPLHVTGNVVFGSSSITPAVGYKLSIDGKVICEELKVQSSAAWPDYVFEDDYNLPSLETVEAKVMAEKHLTGIPSAADVKAQQGIELGDMQRRMLEKIEEMYRYMFQMNKENKEISKENKALKEELSTLKKQVQQIVQ
ncbi:MAG: hypothetical protein V4722_01910 [Bacteroidota bacterium]